MCTASIDIVQVVGYVKLASAKMSNANRVFDYLPLNSKKYIRFAFCEISFQLVSTTGRLQPSVIEETVGGLMVASRKRGQLHGGDLDMMTDALDVVLKQMNSELQGGANLAALTGTVHKVFSVFGNSSLFSNYRALRLVTISVALSSEMLLENYNRNYCVCFSNAKNWS